MRRYIDADELIEFANNTKDKMIDAYDIVRFPTADVAEVVRCKDCKYRDTMPEYEYDDDHMHRTLMGTDFCRWWHDESPNDDDFCSYGERKKK